MEEQDTGVRPEGPRARRTPCCIHLTFNPLIPLSAHDDAARPRLRFSAILLFRVLSRRYEPFNSNTEISFREFVTLSLFADRTRPVRSFVHSSISFAHYRDTHSTEDTRASLCT